MSTMTHRTRQSTWVAVAIGVALLLAALAAPAANAATKDKQPLNSFATGQPITGTFSQLDRSGDAVATSIRTTGAPGHAVTIWYVIFNAPENCNGGACGEDDLFVGGNPANGPNFAQIDAARISVVYGGDGDVVNPGGRVALDGGLAEGEVPTGSFPVVFGDPADGAPIPSPVTGLEDAAGAEIHVVLQDHGMAQVDPDALEAQLSGFNVGCNPTCVDVQFAVHE